MSVLDGCRVGVDVGKTKIVAGVVDSNGALVTVSQEESDIADEGSRLYLQVERMVAELFESSESPIESVGVATFGLVDRNQGVILGGRYLPAYRNIPAASLLESRFGVPAFIENDVLAAAIGEFKYGAGAGKNSMTLVSFGTQVGMGSVLGGIPLRGVYGRAGQIGHLTPVWGLDETIGERLGGAGVSARATSISGSPMSAKEAFSLSRQSDISFKTLVADWVRQAGVLISWIVCSIDPAIVVLTGGLLNTDIDLVGLVHGSTVSFLSSRWSPLCVPSPVIVKSKLAQEAVVLGAASLS